MTYKDRFRRISPSGGPQSSFRGVRFYLPQDELEGGPRGQVHEYPGSNEHTTQYLGESVRRFTVTAFVSGPDHDLERDRLIRALATPGAGLLIHRTYGQMQAEVEPGKTWRVSHSQDQGGRSTFTIPFIRAGTQTEPTTNVNSVSSTKVSADLAKTEELTTFNENLNTLGPEDIRNNIFQAITTANNTLISVNNRVSGALATPTQIAGMIESFGNNLATLIATPSRIPEISEGMYQIVAAIFGVITDAAVALRADLNAPAEFRAQALIDARKVIILARQSREQIAALEDLGLTDNEKVVYALAAQAATTEAARTAVDLPYDSRDAANETREELSAALADLAASSDNDDLYAALTKLRVELSRHLSRTAGELPQVLDYLPARTLPALLIAHAIYGDARRADEIAARNSIRHPGFVPGSVVLKVLADA